MNSMSPPPPSTRSDDEDDEINVGLLFALIWARRRSTALIALMVTSLAIAYALLVPPVWRADALVQLETRSGGMSLPTEMMDLMSEAPESLAEIEIIRSRMVLDTVVSAHGLDILAEPSRLPLIGDYLRRHDLPDPGWNWLRSYAWHETSIEVSRIDVPANWLGEVMELVAGEVGDFTLSLPDERLLAGTVGVLLEDPETGFALLVDQMIAAPGRVFHLARRDRVEALDDLRGDLVVGEQGRNTAILRIAFEATSRVEAVAVLEQITRAYLLQNVNRSAAEAESSLSFVNSQLPEANARVDQAEAALNAYRAQRKAVDLSFETRAMLEQAVEIEAQLSQLKLEEEGLRQRYTPNHPAYRTLLANRAQLTASLAELRAGTADLPATQQEVLSLSQDLQVAQEVYLQLLSRAQELNVIRAGTVGNVRIIDRAQARREPVAPRKSMIAGIGLLLGLVSGIGFNLMRSMFARGIDGPQDVEALNLAVYATVSRVTDPGAIGQSKHPDGALGILAKEKPADLAVESLRSLRTSLHFGMLEAKTKLVMVSSTKPGEGKSFISINLATVMAQANQSVCLLDADIRRGYQRRYFGVSAKLPGLTDYLTGRASVDEIIRRDEDTGLSFITAGAYPPNPSELLMHPRFRELVAELDKRFSQTIVDTPPILAVTDAAIIGKFSALNLLVVGHRLTSQGELKAALKAFSTAGIRIHGAVLNGFDPKQSKYGAAGSEYGTYAYQYDYQSRPA